MSCGAGYEVGLLEPILQDFTQWLPPTEKPKKFKGPGNFLKTETKASYLIEFLSG